MAPTSMKAAVWKQIGTPIAIESVPVPVPQGRELLVRVKAASLCHSDLSITDGELGPLFPQIIGHEAVSVVEELGPEAASFGFKVGDLIGAPMWQGMCLDCFDCRDIGPQFCSQMKGKGLTSPGYFSEYTLVDAANAVVLPAESGHSAASLAPLFCAGITVWDALNRAKLQPGETLAIVGAGGLGELAAKYAQALGAKVIALDVRDDQLLALKVSQVADEVFNTSSVSKEEVAGKVAQLNNGRPVDVALVTSGVVPAYQTALAVLRNEGRMLAVGLPRDDCPVSMVDVALRAIQIIGCKVPGKAGAVKCVDFSIRKGIFPRVHPRRFQLEDINEMIALMKDGQVHDGRMVVQFF